MTVKFSLKTLQTSVYRTAEVYFYILNPVGMTHKCDRETDRQTDRHCDSKPYATLCIG